MALALHVRRLGSGDEALALATFSMMANVFQENDDDEADTAAPPDHAYVRDLLHREDFFVVAAIENQTVVGGITGHVLPMTRNRSSELFIYDLAVRNDRQRRGIGRALVSKLCALAAESGITTSFVPAENEDTHAIDFYRAIGGAGSQVTFFVFTHRPAAMK
jgi:aminoglycoside 3-N-acetyltransferase I